MSNIETVDNISSASLSRPVGTFSVSSFTTSGSGTGAVFRVVIDDDGAASISASTKGSGYATNDTITIADIHLGGGGAVPLTFDVNGIS